jgi:hypothetical protein
MSARPSPAPSRAALQARRNLNLALLRLAMEGVRRGFHSLMHVTLQGKNVCFLPILIMITGDLSELDWLSGYVMASACLICETSKANDWRRCTQT